MTRTSKTSWTHCISRALAPAQGEEVEAASAANTHSINTPICIPPMGELGRNRARRRSREGMGEIWLWGRNERRDTLRCKHIWPSFQGDEIHWRAQIFDQWSFYSLYFGKRKDRLMCKPIRLDHFLEEEIHTDGSKYLTIYSGRKYNTDVQNYLITCTNYNRMCNNYLTTHWPLLRIFLWHFQTVLLQCLIASLFLPHKMLNSPLARLVGVRSRGDYNDSTSHMLSQWRI